MLLTDLRYAWRSSRKSPGHSVALVVVLAMGIGCATGMFTVVNAVLLRKLPFPHPEQVVQVGAFIPSDQDWKALWLRNHSLEALASVEPGGVNLTIGGQTERIYAAAATASLFEVLQVAPVLGRTFTQDEESPGGNRVAVIGEALWRSRYNADPSIPGRAMVVNGEPHIILGVMPREFDFPGHTAVWVPTAGKRAALELGNDRPADLPQAVNRWLILGRLRPGVTVEQADREHRALFAQLKHEGFNTGAAQGIRSLEERMVGNLATPILVLFAAVLFVLFIGCANAANLLLVRAAARRREIAIRACLGAGRGRIARQLLTETLGLTLAGGIAGVAVAWFCLLAIRAVAPPNLPRLMSASIDGRVLAFALGLSLLTGVLCSLAPLLQLAGADLAMAIKDQQSGATSSLFGRRLRGAMVAVEIALALVLVAGAGLAIQSLWRLSDVKTGLEPRNVLTAELGVPHSRYATSLERSAFHHRLLDQAARIPGVVATGAVNTLPYGGKGGGYLYVVEAKRTVKCLVTSGDYFAAIGIPLVAGRGFTARDTGASAPVAIVNREMARKLWGDANPIGRYLQVQGSGEQAPREVVGVVGDIRSQGYATEGPADPPEPEFYLSDLQLPPTRAAVQMTVVLRTAADPGATTAALRRVVAGLDSEMPVFRVRTMTEVLSESIAPPRFRAVLLGTFAALALVLAVLGVYGVVAYATACRTQEIALRISLGAQTRDIRRLVVGQSLRMALAGAIPGVALALWLTRLMSSLLFAVKAGDPRTHLGAAVVLVLAAMAAALLPARRAARIDPASALKF